MADGVPKVLDFGIARFFRSSSDEIRDPDEARAVGVTPNYGSPEGRRMEALTPASDIFSLAMVLYELLTGARPHVDESDSLAKPSEAAEAGAARAIRGELDAILRRALRFRPQDRYASAGALADDLNRYLCGEAVSVMGDGWVYRGRKLVSRRRAMAALGGAALGLGGVAAWAIVKKTEAEERARELLRQLQQKIEQANQRESLRETGEAGDPETAAKNAEERTEDVREVSQESERLLSQSLVADSSPREDREAVVRRIEDYYRRLAPAADNLSVAEQLGLAWIAMGDLWSRDGERGLGSPQDAEQAWREAYDLARPYLDDPRYAGRIRALADELRRRNLAQQP